MCRSIQTLRPPYVDAATPEQVRAAALQYVRKVSGMRHPSAANAAAFEQAVDAVTAATADVLDALVLRAARTRTAPAAPEGAVASRR